MADDSATKRVDTVMVVDDDDNWCFISKRLLKKAGIHNEVITAYNGLEAIRLLKSLASNNEKMPDLVLLDIKMPVMDGFQFLDEILKSDEIDLSSTKIYICSSSAHKSDKERAESYPISGFIIKPLTLESLQAILNSN